MPNASASAVRPSSVTVSARPRGTRFTQPADRKRSSTARPEPAGQMVPLLGPVHAVAHERPFPRWHFDADAGEEVPPGVGQLVLEVVAGTAQGVMAVAARVIATVAADERLAIQQAAHHRHAETARDMVVAVRAERSRAALVPSRSERTGRGGASAPQLLEQLADLGTGQPVVAVPAVGFDGQQARAGQLAEVAAGGRPADPRFVGEHAGGQRPAVVQGEQNLAPGRVGQK